MPRLTPRLAWLQLCSWIQSQRARRMGSRSILWCAPLIDYACALSAWRWLLLLEADWLSEWRVSFPYGRSLTFIAYHHVQVRIAGHTPLCGTPLAAYETFQRHIKVGVHWDTQVTRRGTTQDDGGGVRLPHRVCQVRQPLTVNSRDDLPQREVVVTSFRRCSNDDFSCALQVFCSALPVAYMQGDCRDDASVESLARLMLRAMSVVRCLPLPKKGSSNVCAPSGDIDLH